jgi:hypothetical protein
MELRNGRPGVCGTLVEGLEIVRSARRLRIAQSVGLAKAMATGPATDFIATIQVSSRPT